MHAVDGYVFVSGEEEETMLEFGEPSLEEEFVVLVILISRGYDREVDGKGEGGEGEREGKIPVRLRFRDLLSQR
jgi:hypothetical protein